MLGGPVPISLNLRSALLLPCAFSAILSATASRADSILPPAIATITLGDQQSGQIKYVGFSPSPTTLNYSVGGVTASMNASSSYGLDPGISTQLSLTGIVGPGQYFNAQSEAIYDFMVTSTDPTKQTYCNGPGTTSGSFSLNETIQIATNTDYEIDLFSEVFLNPPVRGVFGSGDSTPATYTLSASIDPTITLDTADPAFSLQFSPAPTPEPASLALVLTGISALALTVIRSRKPQSLPSISSR
jgi:hypothetical protein